MVGLVQLKFRRCAVVPEYWGLEPPPYADKISHMNAKDPGN